MKNAKENSSKYSKLNYEGLLKHVTPNRLKRAQKYIYNDETPRAAIQET